MPAIKKPKKISALKELPESGRRLMNVYTDESVRVKAFYKDGKFYTLISNTDITILVTHWEK